MHRARAFFYVCAGIFLLALSYHLGARNATAQAPGNPVVALAPVDVSGNGTGNGAALTANGDVYGFSPPNTWSFYGNIFNGGPTPAQRESFGALKSRYRGERGIAPTQDR